MRRERRGRAPTSAEKPAGAGLSPLDSCPFGREAGSGMGASLAKMPRESDKTDYSTERRDICVFAREFDRGAAFRVLRRMSSGG